MSISQRRLSKEQLRIGGSKVMTFLLDRRVDEYRQKDPNLSLGNRTQQSAHHAYHRNHKTDVKLFVQRQRNRGATIGGAQTFQRK